METSARNRRPSCPSHQRSPGQRGRRSWRMRSTAVAVLDEDRPAADPGDVDPGRPVGADHVEPAGDQADVEPGDRLVEGEPLRARRPSIWSWRPPSRRRAGGTPNTEKTVTRYIAIVQDSLVAGTSAWIPSGRQVELRSASGVDTGTRGSPRHRPSRAHALRPRRGHQVHGRLGGPGQQPPVRVPGRVQRGGDRHRRPPGPAPPSHPAHRAPEGVVAEEGGGRGRRPGGRSGSRSAAAPPARPRRSPPGTSPAGSPARPAVGRRTAPRRTLRKDRDRPTGAQRGGDPATVAGRRRGRARSTKIVPAAAASSPTTGQAPDLPLGHQPGRRDRQQREDVQPGDVVGDQQRAPPGQPAPDHQPHAERARASPGPSREPAPPARRAGSTGSSSTSSDPGQQHAEQRRPAAAPAGRRHRAAPSPPPAGSRRRSRRRAATGRRPAVTAAPRRGSAAGSAGSSGPGEKST